MKIQVQEIPKMDEILVRRISWLERCTEQLNELNERIQKINQDLKDMMEARS